MPVSMPARIRAPWLADPARARVFAALAARGLPARVVGGAVRNTLLGAPVHDVDVATPALPNEVIEAARQAGLVAIPTGIAHGTVTLVVDGVTTEVTTLREDVETHGRHARVAFTADWAADAARRDFTMNALYCDPDGRLYDPLGGWDDLIARRVRFIGDAGLRIREDYLRVLRFFRFNAQYGAGRLDAASLAACIAEREGLTRLSGERVQQEMRRLLAAPRAGSMIEALIDAGLLTLILGLAPLLRPFQRVIALQEALGLEPDPIQRLGVLSVEVDEAAMHLQRRLKLANADTQRLLGMAQGGRHTSKPDIGAARARLYACGPAAYADALLYAWARGHAAVGDDGWREVWDLPRVWQAPTFPLNGTDALDAGIAPGRTVGETLRALEADWISSDFALTAADLRARLAQRAANAAEPG